MPADADEEIGQQIDNWVKTLLVRAGVQVVSFNKPGTGDTNAYGLLNVPGKYVRIIDAMHVAMHAVARGEPLPEFAPLPEKVRKGVRRKR